MKTLRSQALLLTVAVLLAAVCTGIPGLMRYHIPPRGHSGRWVRIDSSSAADATSLEDKEASQAGEVAHISMLRPESDSGGQFFLRVCFHGVPAAVVASGWFPPFLVSALLYASRSRLDAGVFSFRVAPARAPPAFAI